jgi:hypothetical protein
MTNRTIDKLYHAIPLHYLPSLFSAGALFAQSVLVSSEPASGIPSGIKPRSSATRRDRMLGLDHFVHLSPVASSPLLADKLTRGYPHALLVFDAGPVLDMPELALLPYNTKAWRTRACFAPVTDPVERAALLRRYTEASRLPSMEILVKYGLPLTHLTAVAFIDDQERETCLRAMSGATYSPLCVTKPDMFPRTPGYSPSEWDTITAYFDRCRLENGIAGPPAILFD